MASKSLMEWRTDAWAAFDEIENAHRAVGGAKPGRRFLTQQLNYAYTILLAARFQGFVRALHTQTMDAIARGAHNPISSRGATRSPTTTSMSSSRGALSSP